MNKVVGTVLGSALCLGVTAFVAPAAQAADQQPDAIRAAPNSIYCSPHYSRKYTQTSWAWYRYDTGVISNTSRKATIHKSISYTFSASVGTTIGAEIGFKAGTAVAEINAKTSYSVTLTTSVTKSESFTVDVPPRTKIRYKDGIIVRTFKVKQVQTFSNCDTRTKYTTVRVGDHRSAIADV